MESPPAISYGSLNPDAPGIYIQILSKMNDTDDGMSCPVCLSWKLLSNHDIFFFFNHDLLHPHHKLTVLFPHKQYVPYVTHATLIDVLCNIITSAKE